jgi:hypothetical protein
MMLGLGAGSKALPMGPKRGTRRTFPLSAQPLFADQK